MKVIANLVYSFSLAANWSESEAERTVKSLEYSKQIMMVTGLDCSGEVVRSGPEGDKQSQEGRVLRGGGTSPQKAPLQTEDFPRIPQHSTGTASCFLLLRSRSWTQHLLPRVWGSLRSHVCVRHRKTLVCGRIADLQQQEAPRVRDPGQADMGSSYSVPELSQSCPWGSIQHRFMVNQRLAC